MQPLNIRRASQKSIKWTLVLAALLVMAACTRKFSVSLNEQMLYDPRPGNIVVAVQDSGLQSCINLLLRDRGLSDPTQIQVLACPGLEIETLAGIEQLVNLRFLDLTANLLTNLDGLQRMANLSSVNVPENRLQDISAILAVPTLSSAVLTGNTLIPCAQIEVLSARLGNNLLAPGSCAQ